MELIIGAIAGVVVLALAGWYLSHLAYKRGRADMAKDVAKVSGESARAANAIDDEVRDLGSADLDRRLHAVRNQQ